jgi:hypothetical protein
MKTKEKIESLDSDLEWTWTTICIYKKQGKKNMNGENLLIFHH